jgi:8-oxo-dGTP pyrophosphatase MutT (NUDIX family)
MNTRNILLEKLARVSHEASRLKERTKLPSESLSKLKSLITKSNVGSLTEAGHVRLGDQGYAVVKPVGKNKKPVVATILAKHMSPPGMDLTSRLPLDKLREAIKTAEYRKRVAVFLYDPQGRVLASRHQGGQENQAANWKFPAGGIDEGDTIASAAKREALEEAGYTTPKVHGVRGPVNTTWPETFMAQAKKKGRDKFKGSRTYFRAGPLGNRDQSLLDSEGDALTAIELVPLKDLIRDLEGTATSEANPFAPFDKMKLKGLKALKEKLKDQGVKLSGANFSSTEGIVGDPDNTAETRVSERTIPDPSDWYESEHPSDQVSHSPATNDYRPKEDTARKRMYSESPVVGNLGIGYFRGAS